MRRSSDWDEKTIENHLRLLPHVVDKQSKEELYEKIKLNIQQDKKRKPIKVGWILPTVASAAVLFLMFLVAPTLFKEEQISIEETGYNEQLQHDMTMEMEINNFYDKNEEASLANYYRGAANQEEAVAEQLVTIAVTALYDTGELAVPITLKIEGESLLDRFQQAKDTFIYGNEFGLGAFPSLEIASVREVSPDTVQVDFLVDHQLESLSSAQTVMYSALEETFFALGYNKLTFTTGEEPGVLFGPIGNLFEVDLKHSNFGYFVYTSTTGHKFLVRGRSVPQLLAEDYNQSLSFEEQLELMKQAKLPAGIHSPFPEFVEVLDTFEAKDQVTVVLNDQMFNSEEEALIMIEAILFTARDFGYTGVKFEGIHNQQVGPYNLERVIEVPRFINYLN